MALKREVFGRSPPHTPASAIGPNDKYCFVGTDRGMEYKDVEFQIVQYGPQESSIRNIRTGGLFRFYNAHLYSTLEQRLRASKERRDKAQKIGVVDVMSPKHRKGKR